MNRYPAALLGAALMTAVAATPGSLPSPGAEWQDMPASALGGGCRHIGNNKSPFRAAKRHARNRIAKLSRRRNRGR